MKTASKIRFIASCIIIVLMNLNTFGQITLTVTPPAGGEELTPIFTMQKNT
jgi:hypothetical protein